MLDFLRSASLTPTGSKTKTLRNKIVGPRLRTLKLSPNIGFYGMFSSFGNLFSKKVHKGGPMRPEPSNPSPVRRDSSRGITFSKVFRWRLPDGQMKEPKSVEVVGSFSHWQRVPMVRDSVLDAWHVTFHHIQGNRTHHYMLLVDGDPIFDKTCDGLAVPHGPEEERYQLITDRGPRVFMLFAMTK